ncbi:MAG TPA: prepilin-type N-terminal cleavage/methylation domain-containing protein [Candidatus Rifleibacterium sp.]|nr:prepilin-type N-terminal cleavage/methylation domain-containing protein [Candidatus Rifleibacterium sp.]HPT46337.1 prepilin-type N-terminal cleavage/methylation domain-containing protein [Candidatus Rifleibacterium sp.]
MKSSGFTLIELMIVIALLSITMTYLYPAMQSVVQQDRHQQFALKDAATLSNFYGLMTRELRLCQNVVSADEKGVRFSDDRAIKVLDGGKSIAIGTRVIRLESGARVWGFEKVDDRTFSTQIRNGSDKIRVLWRTGADHE